MRLEWRGSTLVITWLPVDCMGRLAALAPGSPVETEVLAALLAGARVCLTGGPWSTAATAAPRRRGFTAAVSLWSGG